MSLLIETLRKALGLLTRPGPLYILCDKEISSVPTTSFKIRVALPPPVDSDTTVRELTTTINGGTPVVSNLSTANPEFNFFASKSDSVTCSLVDIDADGNRSTPSSRTIVVTDTIPPHQPGSLDMSVVDQVEVPDPVPTP